jgi:ankyrin repeat protein
MCATRLQEPGHAAVEERIHEAIFNALSENSDEWFDELLDAVCSVSSPDGTHPLLDTRHPKTGVTPLMVAAARCRLATVMALLNLGADTSIRANKGKTALDWALCAGEAAAEVVQVLS